MSWQKLRYPARLCGCWQRSRRNHQALMEHSDGKMGVIYPTFEEYPNRQSEEIIAFYPQNADFHYTAKRTDAFFMRTKISAIYS